MKLINELPYNYHWKKRDETKNIVVHHIAARTATVQDINNWHLHDNGWEGGIGYHFYIRKDGSVYQGRPIGIIGAHTRGWNHDSVGVSFEGDFMEEYPSSAQIQSGIEVIKHIKEIYGDLKIYKHKDCNNDTNCPGKYFSDKIITGGNEPIVEQQHWAEALYDELTQKYGIKISEKRFDDPIKRGEVFALLKQLLEKFTSK